MRTRPSVTMMDFTEATRGDTIVVRSVDRKGSTSYITDKLGVITDIHPDIPALIYRPQWARVYVDGHWENGRDIPAGEDVQAFVPDDRPMVGPWLYRVLPS